MLPQGTFFGPDIAEKGIHKKSDAPIFQFLTMRQYITFKQRQGSL
jgi:hypothetical protein